MIFLWFGFRTVFLTIFGALRPPPGEHKSSKTVGGLFKNDVRTTKEKDGPERRPGLHFGVVLAPFSVDFGHQGAKSQKKYPSENETKTSLKNRYERPPMEEGAWSLIIH